MQQQQIKALNTVQNSHAQQKSIALQYSTQAVLQIAIAKPYLAQPYCNQTTKVLFITLESKHNRNKRQCVTSKTPNAMMVKTLAR